MSKFSVVLVTYPDLKGAEKLASLLIKEGLCACINIIPISKSIYSWKGKLCKDKEIQLVIKTKTSLLKKLQIRIEKLHPYSTIEFIAVPIQYGNKPYLKWVSDSTLRG